MVKERQRKKAQPPYLYLGEVLGVIERIYRESGGTVSRDTFSNIIRNVPASSSFQRKLAACRNFGFLKEEGSKITLTDLANHWLCPQSDEEKAAAKKEAFLKIEEFRKVYDRFCGKLLDPDYLPNFFEREVGIDRLVRHKWTKCFMDSAEVAGLLQHRDDGKYNVLEGVAVSPSETETKPEPAGEAPETTAITPTGKELARTPAEEETGYHRSRISVAGRKYAEFSIPDGLTAKDVSKLQNHLDGLKIIVEGLTRESEV